MVTRVKVSITTEDGKPLKDFTVVGDDGDNHNTYDGLATDILDEVASLFVVEEQQ